MNEELKTYKDFKEMKDYMEIDHYTLEIVRQEVVKHWKALSKEFIELEEERDNSDWDWYDDEYKRYTYQLDSIEAQIGWMFYFFRLSKTEDSQ